MERRGRVPNVLCIVMSVVVLAASAGGAGAHEAPGGARLGDDVAGWMAGGAEPLGVFIHFADATPYEQGVAAVRAAGMDVSAELRAAHAVLAHGSPVQARRLAARPEVVFLEGDGIVPLAVNRGGWATRARSVHEEAAGAGLPVLDDADGRVIDGTGVGIAVIDTGIDGNHPAMPWAGLEVEDPKVIRNFMLSCAPVGQTCVGPVTMDEAASSERGGGTHGTHVAGIAAAGTPDQGPFTDLAPAGGGWLRGIAPGASLYGFGTGHDGGLVIGLLAASLQWIYDHGHLQEPPIRVVNNSWGASGEFDPDSVINELVTRLVEDRGTVVVFAAGNEGGDGTSAVTTSYGRNPTPGVVSVANYDGAEGTGRDGALSPGSSRGHADQPSTWPDVSAPGVAVLGPCPIPCASRPPLRSLDPTPLSPLYRTATGTSMAAPQVAAIVALMLQARADLDPGEVEQLLKATAYPFTYGAPYVEDPDRADAPSARTSFDKGHGLVDGRTAVLAALDAQEEQDGDVSPGLIATVADEAGDVGVGALDLVEATLSEEGGEIVARWTARDIGDAPPANQMYFVMSGAFPSGQTRLQLRWDGVNATPFTPDLAPRATAVEGETLIAWYRASDLELQRGSVIVEVDAWTQVVTHPADGRTYTGRIFDATYSPAYAFVGE